MKTRISLLITAFAFSGTMAFAALSTEGVIDALGAEGYTRIEVKVGPTQTKVEAIRGTEKLEVIYDNASGDALKREVEAVRPGENTAPGVSIRNRDKDFLRARDEDDSQDDDSDDDDDNDSDDDNSGSDDDDDSDDDNSGDDDDDDNSGSDDDDDDDDHSGHGGHGGDDGDDHGDDHGGNSGGDDD